MDRGYRKESKSINIIFRGGAEGGDMVWKITEIDRNILSSEVEGGERISKIIEIDRHIF